MSDNLNGIDYSQYQNWQTVTTPSGGTYYVVPGTAYVYDPFLSQAKGKPVLFRNPKPDLDAQSKADQERQDQIDMQKQAASPMGQLLPVAGTVGGVLGANYAIDALGPATAVEKLAEAEAAAKLAAMGDAPSKGFLSFLNSGTGASTGPLGGAGTVPAAPEVVSIGGQAPQAAHPGFIAPGTMAGNALGAAGVALGGYQAFQGIKDKNPLSAGMGGLGIGLGINQLGWALGPAGWAAAIGAPIALSLANKAFDQKSTKEIQADRWSKAGRPDLAGYANADYFAGTGGEQSRDEKYLTPDAIRINPDNYNNIPDWDGWTKEAQDQFLTRMLGEGKVQERKGGIYYDDQFAQTVANDLRSKGVAPKVDVVPATPEEAKKKNRATFAMSAGGRLPDPKSLGKELANRMNAGS